MQLSGNDQHTTFDHFKVKTAARQGCLLLRLHSTLVVGWIMKTASEGQRNRIQWTQQSQLDELDFADDQALLSVSHAQILFYSRLCSYTVGSSPPPESIFLCPLPSLSIPLPVAPLCHFSNDVFVFQLISRLLYATLCV